MSGGKKLCLGGWPSQCVGLGVFVCCFPLRWCLMVHYWINLAVVCLVIFTLVFFSRLEATRPESSVCLVRYESGFQAWEQSRVLIPDPFQNGRVGIASTKFCCDLHPDAMPSNVIGSTCHVTLQRWENVLVNWRGQNW